MSKRRIHSGEIEREGAPGDESVTRSVNRDAQAFIGFRAAKIGRIGKGISGCVNFSYEGVEIVITRMKKSRIERGKIEREGSTCNVGVVSRIYSNTTAAVITQASQVGRVCKSANGRKLGYECVELVVAGMSE